MIVVASALWAAAEEGLQLAQHSNATHAEEHPHTHRERRHARVQSGRDSGGDSAKHRRASRPAFHATAADAQAAAQWADRSKYGGTLVNRGDSLADLPGLRPPARVPDLAHGNATAPRTRRGRPARQGQHQGAHARGGRAAWRDLRGAPPAHSGRCRPGHCCRFQGHALAECCSTACCFHCGVGQQRFKRGQ